MFVPINGPFERVFCTQHVFYVLAKILSKRFFVVCSHWHKLQYQDRRGDRQLYRNDTNTLLLGWSVSVLFPVTNGFQTLQISLTSRSGSPYQFGVGDRTSSFSWNVEKMQTKVKVVVIIVALFRKKKKEDIYLNVKVSKEDIVQCCQL